MTDTILVDSETIQDKNTRDSLKSISQDLIERGYDPIKQITCYLISGDPGYISSYKECRNRICKFDRNSIIELMLKSYIK
ncbi:MAG: IreB family regulatory phosphoprotein [Bacilli bacterium]